AGAGIAVDPTEADRGADRRAVAVRRAGVAVVGTALAQPRPLVGVAVVAGLGPVQYAVTAGDRRVDTSSTGRRAAVVGFDCRTIGSATVAAHWVAAAPRTIGRLGAASARIGAAGADPAVVTGLAAGLQTVAATRDRRTRGAWNGAVVPA